MVNHVGRLDESRQAFVVVLCRVGALTVARSLARRNDRSVAEDLEAEQIGYYRARAHDYDAALYGSPQAQALLDEVIGSVPPGNDVLELACGTGIWTRRLVTRAASVTAVDAAPEMISIAHERAPQATFVHANLFNWQAPRRYDTIFFGFWLSHVPPERFDAFWAHLADALAPAGRVVFVDEHICNSTKETWLAEHVVRRRLPDGSTHRVIKRFLDPQPLHDRLATLNWQADVRRLGSGWVLGEATPIR